MSEDLVARAAEAKAKMQAGNPSVAPGKSPEERRRVPMSLPMQRLEVPDIPGYHLHWFKGTPQRLAQAERAGYEFVQDHEIQLNSVSLGGDATKTGNSDLGSRVSTVEGSETDGAGQAVRMYLMKQKMEWYLADLKISEARNDGVAQALTSAYRSGTVGGKETGEQATDMAARYVDPKRSRVPKLFEKKSK